MNKKLSFETSLSHHKAKHLVKNLEDSTEKSDLINVRKDIYALCRNAIGWHLWLRMALDARQIN